MAKYYGRVGYVKTVEKPENSGIFVEQVAERYLYGDVVRRNVKWTSGDKINGDIGVSNAISVVADSYAYQNMQFMKYVEYMGALWNITDIEPEYPRIKINFGGVYNGRTAGD